VQWKCVSVHGRLADCIKRADPMICAYTLCKQIGGIRYIGGEVRANNHRLSEAIVDSDTCQVFAACKSLQNKAKLRISPPLRDRFDRFLQNFRQCFRPPLEIRTETELL
jgi:hypothetical protein